MTRHAAARLPRWAMLALALVALAYAALLAHDIVFEGARFALLIAANAILTGTAVTAYALWWSRREGRAG